MARFMSSLLTVLAFLFSMTSNASSQSAVVNATAYSLTGQITATGSRAGVGQIAVSRDMLWKYPYGSYVRLVSVKGGQCKGYSTGWLRVTDTMAKYITRTVDVHLPSSAAARLWGRCTATLVKR